MRQGMKPRKLGPLASKLDPLKLNAIRIMIGIQLRVLYRQDAGLPPKEVESVDSANPRRIRGESA